MSITNNKGISLALAVWLVHDEYDYVDEPNYISVTSLMKPIKQIILGARVPPELRKSDAEDFIPSALGHSLHDSIEKAWVKGYQRNLAKLGYPLSVINRVLINPTDLELKSIKDPIPIYLEQRSIKRFMGYSIGGKFDMVAEGIVQDNKSTTAYTWLYGGKDDDYQLQCSLYRWLNPDKITEDYCRINFIFTDWQKTSAKSNPDYPQSRVQHKDIPLLTLDQTETWVAAKLLQVAKYKSSPESEIPECTDEELWRSAPQFKYYTDPTKTDGRSTKNFETLLEANTFMREKGKGVVKTIPGEVKRCGYCPAYEICKQKDRYFS